MTKVTLQYILNGKIDENESEDCLLLPNGVVFAYADGNYGLYVAKKTEKPGVLLVDLDDVTNDLGLSSNPAMLMDFLLAN